MRAAFLITFVAIATMVTAKPQGVVIKSNGATTSDIISRVCEHKTMKLACPSGKSISIESANYGRTSPSFCPGARSGTTTSCKAANTLAIVKGECDGQTSCSVDATNAKFTDPCVGVFKYLQVTYSCEDNPCANRPDGTYAIADVFSFLTCKNHRASYKNCAADKIFVPSAGKCKKAKSVTTDNFCDGRATGNWRNPWNCHSYIACSGGVYHEMPCAETYLVYNPYDNQCEFARDYPCRVVAEEKDENPCASAPQTATISSLNFKDASKDFPGKVIKNMEVEKKLSRSACTLGTSFGFDGSTAWVKNGCRAKFTITFGGYADGDWPIKDVFKYLECKNHSPKIMDCPANKIFDPNPKVKACRKAKNYDVPTFCEFRENGNWRDPWNCHEYIACSNGMAHGMPCPANLVFDPYNNICEYDYKFPCKIVKSEPLLTVADDNPCASAPQTATISSLNFKDASKDFPGKVIKNMEVEKKLSRSACTLKTSFGFDGSTAWVKNGCRAKFTITFAGYPDGKWPIKDVFKYVKCKNHLPTYKNCPANKIYDPNPQVKACRPASNYNLANFCQFREDGDWRNPWDCHKYIACVNRNHYNMPCNAGLVFDPYHDQCEYDYIFKCKQTATRVVASPHRPAVDTCAVCRDVMTVANALLVEKSTEDEIVKKIEEVCPKLPAAFADECTALFSQYGEQVIDLILKKYTDPAEVCHNILKVC